MFFYSPFFGSCGGSVGCEDEAYNYYYYGVCSGIIGVVVEEEAGRSGKEAPESFAFPEGFGVIIVIIVCAHFGSPLCYEARASVY